MDSRYRFYAKPSFYTKDILILDISEESIKRLEPVYGRWPWPRSVHGEIVEYLKADGAKAIGFDIIFSEHSVRQEIDSRLIQELSAFAKNADVREIRAELLQRLNSLRPEASDISFASAVKNAGNVFQSSVFYADEKDIQEKLAVAADEKAASHIKTALSKSSLPAAGITHPNLYFNATIPFLELAATSKGIGYINIYPDKGGVNRRFVPFQFFKNKERAYPSLALLIAAYIKDTPLDSIRIEDGKMFIGDSTLPLLPDNSAFIFYQGGEIKQDKNGREVYQPFYKYIPYDYVLASKDLAEAGEEPPLQKGMFKDKIVLISASAAGLSDQRSTPFSPVTPGIEIHANIIDNILSNKFLRPLDSFYERTYILFIALSIAVIICLAGPYTGLIVVLAALSSVAGIHWKLFESGIVLPIVSPIVVMTATYLGTLLLKYVLEHKEKNYIRIAFGHYIAPAVLEDILKSPEKLKLGGEKRFMTVLFSDVEGFTTLSEQMQPEEVSSLLNEYLSSMAQCIIRTNGTLDKFIGDAVMAIWNAPVEQKDHAGLACETALLMIKELGLLKKKWKDEKRPVLNVRIGINTGEMIVGNMGSKQIFDYTVLGPEVNAAARLEPLNRDFGTQIIVSQITRKSAEELHPERFVFRRLARVVLKGRSEPVEVYELIGFRDEMDRARLKIIERFEKGLELFIDSKFTDAKRHFQELLEIDLDDGPAKAYKNLCEQYEKNPSSDFSGIYFQKTK